ncbi:ParB/RepB/Spo0J family partition protein [Aquincola sp. J276]|uniref:ParB/RepB/Spo0J family partition protein n=1 Tax=Aquincola sp. J276 TaxID=2898432 RepID=UPI002150E82F|nr:ParB/RepB/Spo0J family partition protein [Aquincola sp. J276]MCR5864678.1 ParB/RepB/Spo0J family partition protein [Aquincola sp. J276]
MTNETIIEVPLHQLHDSPLQYRQTYKQSTIDEIAASIKDTGRILQPLVVRLRYPNPLFRDQYDPQDGYEIVFGHTRRRGAEQAGLATAPCIVRSLTDGEVRANQAAENIARADVHPIEEAQGLQAMLDEDQLTADELAASLGKSRSYVYGRLKLLALCPEVRKACLTGEIGTEVGLLIARVGDAKAQQKALQRIKGRNGDVTDGGKASFRQIRDLLADYFTTDLKDAIFDIEDEMLLPSAGHCIRCPKRSGNAPHFDDITHGKKPHHYSTQPVGADVCTDPDCFEAKKKAHLAREARAIEATGKTVIGGNRARSLVDHNGELKGGYISIKKAPPELKGMLAGVKGVNLPRVVVQDPRTGKTVEGVKLADVREAAAKMGIKPPAEPAKSASGQRETPEQREAREAEERLRLKQENDSRRALLDAVRAAAKAAPRSMFDLRLIVETMLNRLQWDTQELIGELYQVDDDEDGDSISEVLKRRLDTMTADQLALLALDCLLVRDVECRHVYHLDHKPEILMAAAKHYGVKVASTPSIAARSEEEAGGGAGGDPSAARARAGADTGLDEEPGEDTADAYGADREQFDDVGCAGGAGATAELAGEVAQ